jgi:SAM-dependent methyltransferase
VAEPTDEARALARLYDVDLLDDPGDTDLYVALAARTGGPILELGVGTGRLAVELASAGHDVTGVDLDAAMLERARARLARAGPAVADRVRLLEGDLLDAGVGGHAGYRLAFIALNTIFLLATRERQRAAVASLSAHLASGGLAVLDVWLPDPDDLGRFDGRLILEYDRTDPETGGRVTKVASARHDPAFGVVDLTSIFDEGQMGGSVRRWIRRDALRLAGPDELASFAVDAGLVVEQLAGSYDLDAIGAGSDRAIVVARKP